MLMSAQPPNLSETRNWYPLVAYTALCGWLWRWYVC